MKMHMIDLLMRQPPVILQDVIVDSASGRGEALGDGLTGFLCVSC